MFLIHILHISRQRFNPSEILNNLNCSIGHFKFLQILQSIWIFILRIRYLYFNYSFYNAINLKTTVTALGGIFWQVLTNYIYYIPEIHFLCNY